MTKEILTFTREPSGFHVFGVILQVAGVLRMLKRCSKALVELHIAGEILVVPVPDQNTVSAPVRLCVK